MKKYRVKIVNVDEDIIHKWCKNNIKKTKKNRIWMPIHKQVFEETNYGIESSKLGNMVHKWDPLTGLYNSQNIQIKVDIITVVWFKYEKDAVRFKLAMSPEKSDE